jgi:hypothetical protein
LREELDQKRPLLVTGAHRSGTTWVGKMLAANGQFAYISEPLNVLHRPGIMRTPVKHWYTYICAENEAHYLPALRETLAYRYHVWDELKSLRSRKDFLRMGRDLGIFIAGRLRSQRPLLKDPFSIFSTAWFAERLDCQVVITVRHPAGFASSLKRLGWDFDFSDLLQQDLLMRDWLGPFRSQMEAYLDKPEDVIGQSSLLWRMIYQVVDVLRTRFPHFIVVRHEDLSLDPLSGYRELYTDLGLDFTDKVKQTILQSSSSENPKQLSKRAVHSVQLDSRANLQNWKRRLSPEETERVRCLTQDLASRYYPEPSWE